MQLNWIYGRYIAVSLYLCVALGAVPIHRPLMLLFDVVRCVVLHVFSFICLPTIRDKCVPFASKIQWIFAFNFDRLIRDEGIATVKTFAIIFNPYLFDSISCVQT